ncbi:MAG TPA: hypothetical protein VNP04_18295 [Alphaproteobacteria bacterium]|nr:hypothetical protein [Alphaproteobacteria bacterium]
MLIALQRDLTIAATAADDAYRHPHRLAVAGCATAKVFPETFDSADLSSPRHTAADVKRYIYIRQQSAGVTRPDDVDGV